MRSDAELVFAADENFVASYRKLVEHGGNQAAGEGASTLRPTGQLTPVPPRPQ
jgi:hypothetical protein